MSEALLALVERIYRAAVEPALWNDVAAEIAALHGAACATFIAVEPARPANEVLLCPGWDPEGFAAYAAHFHAHDITLDWLAALPRGSIVTDLAFPDQDALRRSTIQNDFFRPFDVERGIAVVVETGDGRNACLALRRSERAGPFDDEDAARLRLLVPHIRGSLAIHWQFASLRMARDSFAEALQHLDLAAFIVTDQGRLVQASPGGEEMLARGTALVLRHGCLLAADRAGAASLATLIASALAAHDPGQDRGGVARLLATDGEAFTVLVRPLPMLDLGFGATRRRALVLVRPVTAASIPATLLGQLFGLTAREAALASRLAGGSSLDQAAAGLGISRETARFHLRGIFGKTATRRQAELVARLQSVAWPEARDRR